MGYKQIVLIFSILSFSYSYSQNSEKLKKQLEACTHDTCKVKALLDLGFEYSEISYDTAQLYLNRAEKLINLNLQHAGNSGILNRYKDYHIIYFRCLGCLLKLNGNGKGALEQFKKGLDEANKINDKMNQAILLNDMATIYEDNGDFSKALDYYNQSLKIEEATNNPSGIASSLSNLASVYHYQGDTVLPLKYLKRSLQLHKSINNKKGMATTLNNIALVYFDNLKYNEALINHFESLKIRKSIGSNKGMASSYKNIGNLYRMMSNTKLALAYYDSSYKIASQKNFIEEQIEVLMYMSEIYDKQGNYRIALDFANKAFKNSEKNKLPHQIKETAYNLYKIGKNNSTMDLALKYYEIFVNVRDSLINQENKSEVFRSQLKYEYDKKALSDSLKVSEDKKLTAAKLEKEKTQRYALLGGMLLIGVFAIFIYNRFKVTQNQKRIIELKEKETLLQKDLIEEKHKEITDSINYAERIQRSFLATNEHLSQNLKEYFILFKPKGIVSGDFYWSATLTNGNFVLVTADSTGHGVPGAIMSLLNITSLEKAIETNTSPSEILNATRKTIIERLKKDGSSDGGKDGMDCSLLCFDFGNKKLTTAAANNPIWIVRKNESGVTEILEIKPDKMPVGKHDKDSIPFTQRVTDLQIGDVIYTLTDGFPDQFGGEKGKKFMSGSLRKLLATNAHLPMQEQKLMLEQTFKNWTGNLEQVDDVTVIGIRV